MITRRSLLRSSLGVAAAVPLGRPFLANAAATTAEVWWTQGFIQEEDVAIKKLVADYQQVNGNTIELSITPFAPLRQKIVAAVQSGVVPDMFPQTPDELVALLAWDGKLVDVTDVIETQKEEYPETALLNTYCYNNVEKKRGFYGAPIINAACPNHVWRPLVERAGYKIEDIQRLGIATTISSKRFRRICANKGSATSMASVSRSPPTATIPTMSSTIF
jgi:multiple sugar transport system substrate-binding protein